MAHRHGIDAGANWRAETTARARTAPSKAFSVSVPVNQPETASVVHEQLLSAVIEGVEVTDGSWTM
ncbi:hypothetical protein [Streptomyces sp. NPDC050287]|uniref:hypothetical protein n=1 Tax=Streptomyces sp. NPDC050287 TaxID=3365608 RepID=UPI003792F24D